MNEPTKSEMEGPWSRSQRLCERKERCRSQSKKRSIRAFSQCFKLGKVSSRAIRPFFSLLCYAYWNFQPRKVVPGQSIILLLLLLLLLLFYSCFLSIGLKSNSGTHQYMAPPLQRFNKYTKELNFGVGSINQPIDMVRRWIFFHPWKERKISRNTQSN